MLGLLRRRVVSPTGKPPCHMQLCGFEMVDCWRESTLQLHESKDKLDNACVSVAYAGPKAVTDAGCGVKPQWETRYRQVTAIRSDPVHSFFQSVIRKLG